jgi:hypothetical protein
MPVPTSYSLNLDRPEVYAFLQDPAQTTWSEPDPTKAGYSKSGVPNIAVGTIINRDSGSPPKPCTLTWGIHEYYNVIEGKDDTAHPPNKGVVVSQFDVIIPVDQPVSITVFAVLFTKDGISQQAKTMIEAAFQQYDPTSGVDPNDFAYSKMPADHSITPSMFDVFYTCRVQKNGNAIEHDDQLNKILGQYDGTTQGIVFPFPGQPGGNIHGDDGYFVRRKIGAYLVKKENIGHIPDVTTDPLHEAVNPTKPPAQIIEDVAKTEGNEQGCGEDFDLQEFRIMELLAYPEFKVDWRNFSLTVGCITVIVTLPVLQIRTSEIDLYAYTRYPKNLGDYVVKAIVDCIIEAALAGAVIGVALGNFAAALEAFDALFTECLKDKFGQFISCMIPGLELITKVQGDGQWHDV